jgi:biopolymer transport protein ExbD
VSLRRRPERPSGFLDLTPCSDIIFTLLLFYILTQNFLTHLPMNLPGLSAGEDAAGGQRIERFDIGAAGEVRWNDADLGSAWKRVVTEKSSLIASGTPCVVLVDRQAPAGIVVELLDLLRRHGIQRVTFGGVPTTAIQASPGPR